MLFFPYAVDVPSERVPFINWLLTGSVAGAFVLQILAPADSWTIYVLEGFTLKGLLGHMWLHGDIWHIAGNLLFLWLFGNAVCSKTGNIFYFPVYLFLGAIAGITFLFTNDGSAVGASGAINGIVGMYLVFFPLNDISCVIGVYPCYRTFSVSSFWLIILWLLFDIWGVVSGAGMVAYTAHLGGFAAGFVLAIVLLRTGFVAMEHDERSLLKLFNICEKPSGWRSKNESFKTAGPSDAAIDQIVRERQAADSMDGQFLDYTERSADQFIRFSCSCGQRIKTGVSYSGRVGKCPNCNTRLVIPRV